MRLRQLFDDDSGVSPVIGVILMVAITVILAAVIGAFVLGFGGSTSSAPTATWDTSDEGETVTFEIGSASDEVDASTLSFGGDVSGTPDNTSRTLSAGDSVEYDYQDDGLSGESTVTLVWEEDGSSSTLAEHTMQVPSDGGSAGGGEATGNETG